MKSDSAYVWLHQSKDVWTSTRSLTTMNCIPDTYLFLFMLNLGKLTKCNSHTRVATQFYHQSDYKSDQMIILCGYDHCTSSAASFCRLDFSISTACTHRVSTTSGASLEYRINAATTSLYPGELRLSNFAMFVCAYGRPARSVSSRMGAADCFSTT